MSSKPVFQFLRSYLFFSRFKISTDYFIRFILDSINQIRLIAIVIIGTIG